MTTYPLVSIVVTTKNEERLIGRCLQSIRDQDYPNIEIIVVDNFSNDRTLDIAQRVADIVVQEGPERAAQRNRGLLDLARGELAGYIDADMTLSRAVVSDAVSVLVEDSDAVGIFVPEIIIGKSLLQSIRRFEREFYNGTCIDAVRLFRLDCFKAVGGFDTKTFSVGSVEDWDLDNMLKQCGSLRMTNNRASKLHIDLSAPLKSEIMNLLPRSFNIPYSSYILHDESDIDLKKLSHKKKYYMNHVKSYKEKWPDNYDVINQFSLFYRAVVVFFARGNIRRTLLNPHKYLAILLYRFYILMKLNISW